MSKQSVTGEDMRADDGAYETEEVLSSVGKHLAALTDGELDESPTPKPDDDQDQETEEEPTPDQDSDDDSEVDDSEDQDDDGDEVSEADKKPAIPEDVYQSLIHNDWDPKDITEFLEASPKLALKQFEKIHRDTNQLSRDFSQIGRAKIAQQKGQPQPKQRQASQQAAQQTDDYIDLQALRKDDPDNPLLPVVEAMNRKLKEGSSKDQAQHVQQREQEVSYQEQFSLATQVAMFFGADHMKSYGDFYGPAFDQNKMPIFDNRGLTAGQVANRDALIAEADAIFVGAKVSGREMSVADALQRAHNIITEPIREQMIRKDLVGKVKKRAAGMTLRSTKKGLSKTDQVESKSLTDEQIEANAERRLRKLRSQQ